MYKHGRHENKIGKRIRNLSSIFLHVQRQPACSSVYFFLTWTGCETLFVWKHSMQISVFYLLCLANKPHVLTRSVTCFISSRQAVNPKPGWVLKETKTIRLILCWFKLTGLIHATRKPSAEPGQPGCITTGWGGIKTKWHCRLWGRRAEKEPIMLYRIGDRGLLFEYFGNKMLSLYEDWREERETLLFFSFFFSLFLITKYLYTKNRW